MRRKTARLFLVISIAALYVSVMSALFQFALFSEQMIRALT
jgi:hypothetical protein